MIVGSVPHYPEVGQACRGRDWAKGGIPSPSNAYAPTLAKNVVTESVASPYTAEFCLGFSELGFLEGLAKGGCETRSSAPALETGRSRWCRGKRGAALLMAGFSPLETLHPLSNSYKLLLEHNPIALNRKAGLGILKVGWMGESAGGDSGR